MLKSVHFRTPHWYHVVPKDLSQKPHYDYLFDARPLRHNSDKRIIGIMFMWRIRVSAGNKPNSENFLGYACEDDLFKQDESYPFTEADVLISLKESHKRFKTDFDNRTLLIGVEIKAKEFEYYNINPSEILALLYEE